MTLGITAHRYFEVNAQTASRQEGLLNVINKESSTSAVNQTKKIYLDEGDSRKGLQHIMNGHAGDFQRKFQANDKAAVAKAIKDTILLGDWCTYGYKQSSRGGFTICYQINERNYLQVTVSSSGSIVTAYPRSKVKEKEWGHKKKKRKKEKRRMNKKQ